MSARATAVFVSALLGLGCGAVNYTDADGPRYAGAVPARASDEATFTVATFNVEFAEHVDLAIEELRAGGLHEADVIALQEMDREGTAQIAEAFEMSWVYYRASVHNHGRDFGNAVLSRWPIEADHKLVLPHGAPFDGRRRIAVAAQIAHPSGPVVVYSVHNETVLLDLDARLDQVREILSDQAERYDSDARVVIAGDFNTAGSGGLARTLALHEEPGFFAASPPELETADNSVGSRYLDHVFMRGFEASEHGLAPDRGASDHRALWVRARPLPTP